MNDNQDFESLLAQALGTTEHDSIERAVESTTPSEDIPPGHRSGYAAVVGKPNVGKSTLINRILGEKVAIVSPKPQTTRIQQYGILTRDDLQVIFVDTPGIHQARGQLDKFMVEVAKMALGDADVIIFVTDLGRPPDAQDRRVADYVIGVGDTEKVVHVLNKADVERNPAKFEANFEAHRALMPEDVEFLTTVAVKDDGIAELLEEIFRRLPEGPRYYPRDQVSDLSVRMIVSEFIREQVLRHTQQEVPHAVAVEVDEFKQRKNDMLYIAATIYAEREGQKGIIVGKGGKTLKKISSASRQEIEALTQQKVYLDTWVKVLPNWRRDPNMLKRFGYRLHGT